jgi:hypothetical protein
LKEDRFKHLDFIRVFTNRGLTYTQSERAYSAMIEAFESAMTNKQTVRIGHLGKLRPKLVPPKEYTMGCLRKDGEMDRKTYKYSIGRRVKFVFELHDAFARRSGFK